MTSKMKRPNQNTVSFREFKAAPEETGVVDEFSLDGLWFRLGPDGRVQAIFSYASLMSKERISKLKLFTKLEELNIYSSSNKEYAQNISDTDVEHILACTSIKGLQIFRVASVSEKALELALESLSVTHITFASTPIKHLGSRAHLNLSAYLLNLSNCPIGDNAINRLAEIQGLERLFLRNTKITQNGALEISRKMPACRITWSSGFEPDTDLLNGKAVKQSSGQD